MMRILNGLTDKLNKTGIMRAAYLEKPLNDRYEDIHLHVLLKPDKKADDELFSVIKEWLERDDFPVDAACEANATHETKVFRYVFDRGFSLYLYQDSRLYYYQDPVFLYNPEGLKPASIPETFDSQVIADIIKVTQAIILELHKTYQYRLAGEKELAFTAFGRAYHYLFCFLSDFHLRNPYNHSFKALSEKMSKTDCDNIGKITGMYRPDLYESGSRMMVWSLEQYLGRLPIEIAGKIGIEYLSLLKRLFFGR